MGDRERLEELRARARLEELRTRAAGGAPEQAAAPSPAPPRPARDPVSDPVGFDLASFEDPEAGATMRYPPEIERSRVRAALEIGGGVAAGFIPGMQPAAGATLLPRVGLLAARMGLVGAGAAGGSLAAETVDPSESAAQMMTRAATSGVTGAAGEGAGALVAASARAAAPAVRRFAETQGAKALGLIQSGFRRATVPGARAMAREALDAGVITPLASAETMLARATAAGDDAGQALGALRDRIDRISPGENVLPLAAQLQRALTDWQPGTSAEAAFRPHLERVVQDLYAYTSPATGKISAEGLASLKKMLADTVYTDPLLSAAQVTGALRPRTETARGVVQEAEERLARRVLPPDEFAAFGRAKTRYGAMSKAQEALEQRLARDVGNNQVFGLSPLLTGIGASAYGNPAAGLLAAFGTRFASQRGNQISATAAQRLVDLATSRAASPAARSAAQAILQSARGD